MNHLARLGFTEARRHDLESLSAPELTPMRVAVEHRGRYALVGPGATLPAELSGRLRYTAAPGELPVVGDWVAVRRTSDRTGDRAVIHAVLPRTSRLARRRPGGPPGGQLIAANVDVVFVVTSANRDLNPRRLERTLSLVWSGGAAPVVVLTKVDACDDPAPYVAQIEAVALGVPILVTSGITGQGLAALEALLPPGVTGALVGSSGVGKSTLVNALCGTELQATREIRLWDDRGRHTTTRRELVELPCGGLLIDTPGMRELGLWDEGDGTAEAFADIEELAEACRFRDCTHAGEPGCAVAEAVDAGALTPERLASRDKLLREEAWAAAHRDPVTAGRSKQRWKQIHVALRQRKKVDPKLADP